ncbi:phosphoethanolamine transferase [uncultured Prevotella sp.]|uniref:phosphoethanolamine transferase n=1 Tax=uncultured Prevotella sp. TaxID=159272 RepID=UPI00338E18A8
MDTIVYTHLCRAMAISYLFTCIVYYSHKKWVKVLFLAIGCMLFGLNIFLWLVFHKIISPQIITLIGETNYTEASEFLSTFLLRGKGLLSLFILTITISIIIYVEKKKNFLQIKNATCFCILSAIILLSSAVGFYHFNVYYQIFKSKTVDDCQIGDIFPFDALTATIYSLNAIRTTNNEMNFAIKVAEAEKGGSITEKDSLHIILIIGESYIKSHSQVYGYGLPTTPNLKLEEDNGNLFVFNNVVSPFNGTSPVLKNLFCCNSIAEGEKWYKSPFFPTCFKRSGYTINYWDNQRVTKSQGTWDFSMNSFLFDKRLCQISYSEAAPEGFPYDDQLISDFERSGKKKDGKYVFDIFHLWGQHVDASERYPHGQFSRFSAKDIRNNAPYMTESKKQDIANYDNATYYNDYVINHIINLYRDKNTVVVYFSDHGEEIYDYRDSKGRVEAATGQEKNWLKYQFEVPFVIWCSDKYKALHPDIVRRIKASLNRPFMTDNTCHLLFDLAGLKTIYYRAERDLISPKFKPSKRIVNNNTDFDAVMRK